MFVTVVHVRLNALMRGHEDNDQHHRNSPVMRDAVTALCKLLRSHGGVPVAFPAPTNSTGMSPTVLLRMPCSSGSSRHRTFASKWDDFTNLTKNKFAAFHTKVKPMSPWRAHTQRQCLNPDVLHELQIGLGAPAQHGAPVSHAAPRPTIP